MTEHRCEFHSGVEAEMSNLKDSDKLQWEAIEEIKKILRERLPYIWVVVLMALMGSCGYLLKCVIH